MNAYTLVGPTKRYPCDFDRAIGGNPGSDLAADLAAIDGSFGVLAGEDTFARGRDERMDYLSRLAEA